MILNFNQLAWEAPIHGSEYGYLPTDEYYNDIMNWLKTGTVRWQVKSENGIFTVRKEFDNSKYDVVVTYNSITGLIMWRFILHYVYEV